MRDGSQSKDENGLTPKMEAFCHAYVSSGGAKEASAIAAGYGKDGARTRAYELIHKDEVQARIRALTNKSLAALGAEAVEVLKKLMTSAKSESVRQGCAVALLDRAGYAHATVIEIDDKRSIEEIDNELEDLIRQAGKEAALISEKVLN